MEKKLYRAREGRVIGGVAAGLAEYFDVDPILVRVIFVILVLANGLGILGYIIFLIVTPEEPARPIGQGEHMDNNQPQPPAANTDDRDRWRRRGILPGVILVALGLIFLVSNFVPQYDMGKLWPILLVVVGVALLWPRKR
ncbi:MAG: PspC domain-containing protein [Candidatus Saccharibacteria bacterium]